MRVIYENLPSKRIDCIATIGVFDGVHLGHKFLFDRLSVLASQSGLSSLAITFDILPEKILSNDFCGSLTDIEAKQFLISQFGLDMLWVLKTDAKLLSLSADSFLKVVTSSFNIKRLVVGDDFRFGNQAKEDITYLQKVSSRYGFEVESLKKQRINGQIISSTLIRDLIRKSSFAQAESFLGHQYRLRGRVVKGLGIGKKLGFPTLNIYPFDYIIPKSGVYSGYVWAEGKKYPAAFNIGTRPTLVNLGQEIVEAHLIGFKKNILGDVVELEFVERLRDENKFRSHQELKAAIAADVKRVRTKYSAKNNDN